MAQWAVVIPDARLAAEKLFHHDTLELTGLDVGPRPAVGDDVLVVVAEEPAPRIVALGRVAPPPTGAGDDDPDDEGAGDDAALVVTYTRRSFDDPAVAERLPLEGPVTLLDPATYRLLAARLAPAVDNRTWLVSLDLPIEAPSPAEAVRLFWTYVMELGPRELPAFVSPSGDELAMQAFVLGAEANQDPEEED